MNDVVAQKFNPRDPLATESQHLLSEVIGYLLAVVVGVSALTISSGSWIPASRFDLPTIALFTLIPVALTWVFAAGPFFVIRLVSRRRGLDRLVGAFVWGAFFGILCIPYGVALPHCIDIDGSLGPYGPELAKRLTSEWLTYVRYGGSGALGGAAYWLVAFSPLPTAISRWAVELIRDEKQLKIFGFQISARWRTVLGLTVAAGASIFAFRLWWSPHVDSSTSSTVPPVHLEREIKVNGGFLGSQNPVGIGWSRDGKRLVSGGLRRWRFTAWNLDGALIRQLAGQPSAFAPFPVFVGDGNAVVISGNFKGDKFGGFSAIDLKTGAEIHEEPEIISKASAKNPIIADIFVISPDGEMLAVASGFADDCTLKIFSTKNWRSLIEY